MKLSTRIRLPVVSAVLCLAGLGLAARAADENPLKNAKVGDWVELANRTETMGQTMTMQMKQSVVAKDETSVTLRTEVTMGGMKMPGQDVKVPFNQPYEPYKQNLTDAKVTSLGEGDETITVGGKSYKCHWSKVKVTAAQPQPIEMTAKVWTCKDVPVHGMVRMESEGTMKMGDQGMTMKTSMELVGSGSK